MVNAWAFRMAWRDSRGSRKRLLLFLLSMVLGVAALVSINSFGVNLRETVDAESRSILGADLSFESGHKFSEEAEALIDSLGGEQSRSISFPSMVLFPRTGATRLVTVRAMKGGYPYYGEIETQPVRAARTYLDRQEALVDATLMDQFQVAVGDSVRIGDVMYRIAGRLIQAPRENQAMTLFSPRVYVPLDSLDRSLLGLGSRADYEAFFRFPVGTDVEALAERLKPRLKELHIGYDTVEEVKENWNDALSNLYRFLSLIGFVALLLGGLGIASSIHVYVKQRIETIAVLRCLGAKTGRTVGVYLIQAVVLGLLGGALGSLVGIVVQLALPSVLQDFLPVTVSFHVVWSSVLLGVAVGAFVTVLFALLPLLTVRRVSPLRALRASYDAEGSSARDPLRWLVVLVIAAGLTGFAVLQAPFWQAGVGYAVGVAVVFGLLALVAWFIMFAARRFFPSRWAYAWRQGLANLYRPHNQTAIMLLALGLGTFLIVTLFQVQRTLLNQIQLAGGDGQPNLVLFDIQPAQLDSVEQIVRAHGLPVLRSVPIVTMRLVSVKGVPVDTLKADSTYDDWALNREYRSTYRDHLTDTETLTEGTFVGQMPEDEGDQAPEDAVVPVSVEQGIAEELKVAVGDSLTFNISGVDMDAVVSSIREVDWRQLSTNFFIVFPEGPLDNAPQFSVILTHASSDSVSAALQSAVVRAYPGISAIDLSTVMNVFDAIFGRIAFVIRFMALFSVLTGLVVLAGAVVVSRFQRAEESVLLKTLGASRGQIFRITLVEYFFLGVFSALTGLVLAFGAGWGLAKWVFETAFVPDYLAAGLSLVAVTGLTIAIGLLNSRGIYDRPPLEVLRAES